MVDKLIYFREGYSEVETIFDIVLAKGGVPVLQNGGKGQHYAVDAPELVEWVTPPTTHNSQGYFRDSWERADF